MENKIIISNNFDNCYPLIEGIDENGYGLLSINAEELIVGIENRKKEITDLEEKMKEALQQEMEKRGIVKIVTDKLLINYSPEQKNIEKFNKKLLREINPDLYDECITMDGIRKAYITIKQK